MYVGGMVEGFRQQREGNGSGDLQRNWTNEIGGPSLVEHFCV